MVTTNLIRNVALAALALAPVSLAGDHPYETDAERRQGWAEAEATFGQIMSRLPALGYTPLVVPTGDLGPRAAFVLARAV